MSRRERMSWVRQQVARRGARAWAVCALLGGALGAVLLAGWATTAEGAAPAGAASAGAGAPSGGPARIITMAPNLTEIVFSLGAGDRLVAVSEYSDHPREARALPRVGGFINPDIERVLAYGPDLVILRDYSTRLEGKLRAFDVPVLRVRDESIADILEAVRAIGEALGSGERARSLIASIEEDLEQFRRRPEPAHRPRVLLVTGRSPGTLQDLYAPGDGTFLHEMIRLAGGANLFADSRIPYPKLSKEEIIARDPEVIVEPVSASSYSGVRPDLRLWETLGSVSAVRHGRLHLLEGDYVLIPGPRIGLALRDLDQVIRAYDEGRPPAARPAGVGDGAATPPGGSESMP